MPGIIDLYKLSHTEIVDLYRLDLRRWGGNFIYFCNYARGTELLEWGGQQFLAWSFESSDWEYTGRGQSPEPKIVLSNLFGEVSALCKQYRDLNLCELTRYQVWVSDLSITNYDVIKSPDVWQIDRKTQENANIVSFTLSSTLNVEGATIPGRKLLANSCNWLSIGGFRGVYCQYNGTATSCDGRLATCRALGNAARYGGAPSVDNNRLG